MFIVHISIAVCQLFQQEVVAIFAPVSSTSTVNHIRSTSKALSVPHIETGFEYLEERSEFSVNLSPHPWAIGSVSIRNFHIPQFLRTAF